MIYGSDEASIEEFIEINDEMDAKPWFIKHLFSVNKVFKYAFKLSMERIINKRYLHKGHVEKNFTTNNR